MSEESSKRVIKDKDGTTEELPQIVGLQETRQLKVKRVLEQKKRPTEGKLVTLEKVCSVVNSLMPRLPSRHSSLSCTMVMRTTKTQGAGWCVWERPGLTLRGLGGVCGNALD